MSTPAVPPPYRPVAVSAFVVLACIGAVAFAIASGQIVLGILILSTTLALAAWHDKLLSWRTLFALLILILIFIPIRRYAMGGGLPFQLEPYRLYVGFLVAAWVTGLLIDRRVRLRATGLEGPIAAVVAAIVVSILVNLTKIENQGLMTNVLKSLTFFMSFFVLIYILRSTIRRPSTLDFIIQTLVVSAAILAIFAVIESRTRVNAFNNLHAYLPFLHPIQVIGLASLSRGARLRAYATAEHPIALGAAFALIVPLAGYLVLTKGRRWIVPLVMILAGALAPVSRTALVMLFVIGIIFLRAQPTAMRRFWPALIPMIVAVHLALPGTLGTLRQSFTPQGGIVAEQQANKQGRLADWGPTLREWSNDPLSGRGFGTVIIVTGGIITPTTEQLQNDRILDDQWLGTLRETGLFGVVAFAWLFFGAARRLRKAAEGDTTSRGTLLQCLRASIIAFAIGMWTYDAFSFVQVTLLLFIILGFASVALSPEFAGATERARVPLRPRLRPGSAPAPA